MENGTARFVHVSQLRVGMFVQLDLGWMKHPFPIGSFKIASTQQIETIRGLGLVRVRYVPEKSDLSAWAEAAARLPPFVSETLPAPLTAQTASTRAAGKAGERLAAQLRSLGACERNHAAAIDGYTRIASLHETDPRTARAAALELVGAYVSELVQDGDSSIRLLPLARHDCFELHPVNVMVLSLLLGRATGMLSRELLDLGTAAVLHDIGVPALMVAESAGPAADRPRQAHMWPQHVVNGVAAARRMVLPDEVVRAIAEHHERTDGDGFPAGLRAEEISIAGKIIALVNCYDNLCNPAGDEVARSPYEALSTVFGQQRSHFDPAILGAFIRMMGLYPPGSLIQLADDRHAMVVAVNSSRPLRPLVLVHDASVPRADALLLDLEQVPDLAIRRALKADQLPPSALAWLDPPPMYRYFFEHTLSAP